jgi:NAD(P)-dependent dehydrogenase (short-subunit alcohol dehydrogenase family)
LNFTDKVVLVTGAGRGIGQAIAIAFTQAGARAAVNDINPESCAKTAAEITALGGQALACHADVANKLAVQAMLIDIEDRWGRVDILINNAGVEPHQPIVQLDEWDWNRTLDVNLKGAFLCAQSAGRMMRQQGGGVIVNIASIAGRAAGLRDRSAYVASKTGLVGFTKECAREFAAYNIRVNAVCPGVIITEMTAHLRANEAQLQKWLEDIPLGRLGDPEDVTGLVLFLCSDAARYITGQAINVDGGKVML